MSLVSMSCVNVNTLSQFCFKSAITVKKIKQTKAITVKKIKQTNGT